MQIVTSSPKKIMYKFLLFTCFWLARQQLNFGWRSGWGVIGEALARLRAHSLNKA